MPLVEASWDDSLDLIFLTAHKETVSSFQGAADVFLSTDAGELRWLGFIAPARTWLVARTHGAARFTIEIRSRFTDQVERLEFEDDVQLSNGAEEGDSIIVDCFSDSLRQGRVRKRFTARSADDLDAALKKTLELSIEQAKRPNQPTPHPRDFALQAQIQRRGVVGPAEAASVSMKGPRIRIERRVEKGIEELDEYGRGRNVDFHRVSLALSARDPYYDESALRFGYWSRDKKDNWRSFDHVPDNPDWIDLASLSIGEVFTVAARYGGVTVEVANPLPKDTGGVRSGAAVSMKLATPERIVLSSCDDAEPLVERKDLEKAGWLEAKSKKAADLEWVAPALREAVAADFGDDASRAIPGTIHAALLWRKLRDRRAAAPEDFVGPGFEAFQADPEAALALLSHPRLLKRAGPITAMDEALALRALKTASAWSDMAREIYEEHAGDPDDPGPLAEPRIFEAIAQGREHIIEECLDGGGLMADWDDDEAWGR